MISLARHDACLTTTDEQILVDDILRACSAGDTAEMCNAMDVHNLPPDVHDDDHVTPLQIAAAIGCHDMVVELLNRGATVDAPNMAGVTPIMHAVYHGHHHLAAFLMTRGASPFSLTQMGTSCATLAARHGNVATLQWLLSCGLLPDEAPNAKLMTVSPLAVATVNDKVDYVKALMTARVDVDSGIAELQMSPLALAAQFSQEQTMNILLSHGADPNAVDIDGSTPAELARHLGRVGHAETLQAHTTNQRTMTRGLSGRPTTGNIFTAVINGEERRVRELLAADPSIVTQVEERTGATALTYAASVGRLDLIVSIATKPTCNVDHQDINGWTPLMHALHNGHITVAKFLLNNNANPGLKSTTGLGALHLATSDDTPADMIDVIELLVNKEAEWSIRSQRRKEASAQRHAQRRRGGSNDDYENVYGDRRPPVKGKLERRLTNLFGGHKEKSEQLRMPVVHDRNGGVWGRLKQRIKTKFTTGAHDSPMHKIAPLKPPPLDSAFAKSHNFGGKSVKFSESTERNVATKGRLGSDRPAFGASMGAGARSTFTDPMINAAHNAPVFNRRPMVNVQSPTGGVYMGDVDSPTIGEGAFAQTWSSAQMSNVARENRHEAARLASMLGAGRMQRLRGKENRFQLSHNQAATRPNTQQYIASAAKHMPTSFASNSVVHALGSQRSSNNDHRFVQPPPPPPHRQHAYMTQHSVDVLQSTPPNTPAAIVGYIMNDNSPGASFNRPYNQSANSAARYKPVGQEDTIDELGEFGHWLREHGFASTTVSAILDAEIDGLDTFWHMTFEDLLELKTPTDEMLARHEVDRLWEHIVCHEDGNACDCGEVREVSPVKRIDWSPPDDLVV